MKNIPAECKAQELLTLFENLDYIMKQWDEQNFLLGVQNRLEEMSYEACLSSEEEDEEDEFEFEDEFEDGVVLEDEFENEVEEVDLEDIIEEEYELFINDKEPLFSPEEFPIDSSQYRFHIQTLEEIIIAHLKTIRSLATNQMSVYESELKCPYNLLQYVSDDKKDFFIRTVQFEEDGKSWIAGPHLYRECLEEIVRSYNEDDSNVVPSYDSFDGGASLN